jgi:hypothetical protein
LQSQLGTSSKEALGIDPKGKPMEEDWSYLAIIEMLLYLLTNMRPDIAFAISQVVHFNHNPKKSHATAIKMITRHLLGMLDIYTYISI